MEKSMQNRGVSRHLFPFDTRLTRDKKGNTVFFLLARGRRSSIRMRNLSHNWRRLLTDWIMKRLKNWFGRIFGETPECKVALKKGHEGPSVNIDYNPHSLDDTKHSIENQLLAFAA